MNERREIPFGRPWLHPEDREAVMRVLGGHVLTHGPECRAFEGDFAAFLGPDAHALTASSCMAALHMAYLVLGVGPGDEVIAPALTHTATVHAIEWVGARPVFVDCEPGTGNLDARAAAAAVTPRTKALTLVHFAGIPTDMTPILALAAAHGLRVVEDCAIALGARHLGRHVGLSGDVGAFSFYPVKHITTAEGGMFVSHRPEIVAAAGRLRAFGVDRSHTERSIPGMYDVTSLGLNYRMSELQAALGRTQLARFTENLARRRRNFVALATGLGGLPVRVLASPDPAARTSDYCLVALLEPPFGARRDAVVKRLGERGVGTSIYYPHPVPRLQYYREKYGYTPGSFPNAARVSDESIALPVGPHLEEDDMRYIATALRDALEARS